MGCGPVAAYFTIATRNSPSCLTSPLCRDQPTILLRVSIPFLRTRPVYRPISSKLLGYYTPRGLRALVRILYVVSPLFDFGSSPFSVEVVSPEQGHGVQRGRERQSLQLRLQDLLQ